MINSHPHYAFLIQQLIHAYNSGALDTVLHVTVEPEYGFVAMIHYKNGSRRYINGANVDVNPSGAADIVLDKGFAKLFMQQMEIPTARGRTFLMPHYYEVFLRAMSKYNLREAATVDDLRDYARNDIGFPCYLKPNDGARGKGVFRCADMDDIEDALAYFIDNRVDLVLAEAAINIPNSREYRVTVYNGEVFASYGKRPFSVTGDGVQHIRDLMAEKQRALLAAGHKANIDADDPRIAARLKKSGLSLEHIPARGHEIQLQDIANISSGGIVTDFTAHIHPDWVEICTDIAKNFALVLCGIDIICTDVTQPRGDYQIIEINAAPSLSGFASASETAYNRVAALYCGIFNTPPNNTITS